MQNVRNRKERVSLGRISVPKPQDILANQLRTSILSGEIPEGEALPSERDLVTQTGLTRGAVREALRTLAAEGLVETTHGRFGGSVVTLPSNDAVAAAISRFVEGRRLPLHALHEARDLLEPFLARLAAERRSDQDVAELTALHNELVAALDNFQEFAWVNVKWHNAVAKASGNDLLAAVLASLSHGVHVATTAIEYETMETRQSVVRIHARINEAIAAKNSELAERRMRQHISATQAHARSAGSTRIPLSDAGETD